jgi:outer membrane protein TolC
LLAAAIIFIATWPGCANSGQVSLEEAVGLALQYNPDFSAAARELTIANSEIIRANYFSQFNPVFANAYNYRERYGRSNSNDWRGELSQELEVFGQKEARRKSADLRYKRTQEDIRDQRRLLVATVRLTFFEAMLERDKVRLLERLEDLDRSLNAAAQARLKAGKISEIESNLAQVRLGQTRRDLVDGRDHYRVERSSLGRLLAGRAGLEPEPAGDYNTNWEPIDLDSLLSVARNSRPDLRARQLEIARLASETVLNSRLALPNPTIGAFAVKESNTNQLLGATLGFSIPVFNGRRAEAAALAGQRAQAQDRLSATELDVDQQVRDAYYRYLAAREGLEIYRDQVVAPARESFDLLNVAFNEGKIDLLLLSVALRQSFEAQMTYFDAYFGMLQAQVALELAAGVPLESKPGAKP